MLDRADSGRNALGHAEADASDTVSDMIVHSESFRKALSRVFGVPDEGDALDEALIDSALNGDGAAILSFAETLFAQNASFSDVYRRLIAPASARIDQMWREDEADFVGISIATARLEMLVKRLQPAAGANARRCAHPSRRVLLGRMAGEQHTLGLTIAAVAFEAAGWRVDGGSWLAAGGGDGARLETRARDAAFDVVGLTIGSARTIGEAQAVVVAIRAANPRTRICVGGRPAVVAALEGVDYAMDDALEAPALLNAALDARDRHGAPEPMESAHGVH